MEFVRECFKKQRMMLIFFIHLFFNNTILFCEDPDIVINIINITLTKTTITFTCEVQNKTNRTYWFHKSAVEKYYNGKDKTLLIVPPYDSIFTWRGTGYQPGTNSINVETVQLEPNSNFSFDFNYQNHSFSIDESVLNISPKLPEKYQENATINCLHTMYIDITLVFTDRNFLSPMDYEQYKKLLIETNIVVHKVFKMK
jgi:hypothetical protein